MFSITLIQGTFGIESVFAYNST